MSEVDKKDIINTIYHSAIETGLIAGYSMIGKKVMKLNLGDPSKADINDILKLTGVVALSVITKDWLIKNKIIPEDIVK